MKVLRFSEPLPKLILNDKKTTTWRINDDKNIQKDDKLSFCFVDGREFARAVVLFVAEKRFQDIDEQDREGHEKFDSDKEMYLTYSRYYGFQVTPETRAKIIKFKLI
jgi:hypothetical protein